MPVKSVMKPNVSKISALNCSKGSLKSDITGVKNHLKKRDSCLPRLLLISHKRYGLPETANQ